jgi:hypothetical protein
MECVAQIVCLQHMGDSTHLDMILLGNSGFDRSQSAAQKK